MNHEEKITDSQQFKDALLDLNRQMHIPAEVFLTYIRGEWSADVGKRIDSHLAVCADCREILASAKKVAEWEKETASISTEPNQTIPFPASMEAKLHLVATINRNRKKITQEVAKLFLPEESWYSLPLIIDALDKFRDQLSDHFPESQGTMLAAAFASEAGLEEQEQFECARQALDFTEIICNLLSERAQDVEQIQTILPECITEAIHVLKAIEKNEEIRRKLLKVILQNLVQ